MVYNAWKRLLISCDLPILKINHMIWTNSQDIYYSFVLLSRCSIGHWFESPYHYQTTLILYLRFFLDYKRLQKGFVFAAAGEIQIQHIDSVRNLTWWFLKFLAFMKGYENRKNLKYFNFFYFNFQKLMGKPAMLGHSIFEMKFSHNIWMFHTSFTIPYHC